MFVLIGDILLDQKTPKNLTGQKTVLGSSYFGDQDS